MKLLLFNLITFACSPMKKILQSNVKPEHYDLSIVIFEDEFAGKVRVDLDVLEETETISFNSVDLELSDCKIIYKDQTFLLTPKFDDEVAILNLENKISANEKVQFEANFKSVFKSNMIGFYKSMYNANVLYSTHFEPTDARRAFPCWDQPDMKATFKVSLSVPEGLVALSNSEVEKVLSHPIDFKFIDDHIGPSLVKKPVSLAYKTYTFRTTPKMSTYLVAFVVGKLEFIEGKAKRGVPIRVYADKNETEWGRFALEVAVHCLDFFEFYFAFEYPFPKLDLVTVPAFAMGAMENWGLVTFRKSSLLYNKNSVQAKKLISETVCHEIAHMWFGNLVTMQWWDDLWLNEGFATWAASLAVSNLPKHILDWDVWITFINSDIERGMGYDALKSTHPIAVPVEDPADINQIFDSISYSKGASIIKMMEDYIGYEKFREGIRRYIRTFKYSNATTEDLWDKVFNDKQMNCYMNVWIKREGFPLLIVEELDGFLVINQERFCLDKELRKEKCSVVEKRQVWPIPVKITFFEKGSSDFMLKDKVVKIEQASDLYKLNSSVSGFYRVKYPEYMYAKLLKTEISDSNRLNLLNDYFELAYGSYLNMKGPLSIVSEFKNEKSSEILGSLFSHLGRVKSVFYDDSKKVEALERLVRDMVSHRIGSLEYAGKDINEISLNVILVSQAVYNNDESLIMRMRSLFEDYVDDKSVVSAEYLRPFLVANVNDRFDAVKKMVDNPDPEVKNVALFALGRVEDEVKISEFVTDIFVQPQDLLYLFAGLSSNIKCRKFIVDLVMKKIDNIKAYLNNSSLFNHILESVFSVVSSEDEVNLVNNFLRNLQDKENSKVIEKIIEKNEIRKVFRNANEDIKFV